MLKLETFKKQIRSAREVGYDLKNFYILIEHQQVTASGKLDYKLELKKITRENFNQYIPLTDNRLIPIVGEMI